MKQISDFRVEEITAPAEGFALIKCCPVNGKLPAIVPGQFVNVRCDGSKSTFLRRPISINFVDYELNQLWLLVKNAGNGTAWICSLKKNDILNMVLPLGNGFTIDVEQENEDTKQKNVLLVGGGVGTAPMLLLASALHASGSSVTALIGARKACDLLEINYFKRYGNVCVATEDGSEGEPGLVTAHSAFNKDYDRVYCCGPLPMMKAVAAICRSRNIPCEVSLENMMACGVGACLCCVEDTKEGHKCVCTDGPVFDINDLKW